MAELSRLQRLSRALPVQSSLCFSRGTAEGLRCSRTHLQGCFAPPPLMSVDHGLSTLMTLDPFHGGTGSCHGEIRHLPLHRAGTVEGRGDPFLGLGCFPIPWLWQHGSRAAWGAMYFLWCFSGLEDEDLEAGAGEGVGEPLWGTASMAYQCLYVCPLVSLGPVNKGAM